MKKNQLIKSSFKESPISKDCPRNSHFQEKYKKNLENIFKNFQKSLKFLDPKIFGCQ